MPELTLWIGDDLAESPVHLENLLGRGGLTDSRADERVPEPNPVVGDPDQVRVDSGLKGFDAGSAGPRDPASGQPPMRSSARDRWLVDERRRKVPPAPA